MPTNYWFLENFAKGKELTKASLELTRVMILSLLHLMSAIPHVHASTCVTILMCEKNSLCHFCLWHLLSGTLEQGKWMKEEKNQIWSFFFNVC